MASQLHPLVVDQNRAHQHGIRSAPELTCSGQGIASKTQLLLHHLQMTEEAEAAKKASSEERKAAPKLSPAQLQRLKERNDQLMQRKLEAAAQKQRQEEERVVRTEMLQEQVQHQLTACRLGCHVGPADQNSCSSFRRGHCIGPQC